MRWPSCKQLRDGAVCISGRFVFGMQVFGADERTFPFLAKYPDLSTACGNLVRTLTTKSEYPEEQPVHLALNGFDMEVPGGGTSGVSMGGNGGEGMQDDDG
jgi:hypothetical protein